MRHLLNVTDHFFMNNLTFEATISEQAAFCSSIFLCNSWGMFSSSSSAQRISTAAFCLPLRTASSCHGEGGCFRTYVADNEKAAKIIDAAGVSHFVVDTEVSYINVHYKVSSPHSRAPMWQQILSKYFESLTFSVYKGKIHARTT